MRFKTKSTPLADRDAWKAVKWYNKKVPGLGERFLNAVAEAIQSLETDATIYRERPTGVRRVPVPGFEKVGVFYRVDGSDVLVVAVLHGAMHPARLRRR